MTSRQPTNCDSNADDLVIRARTDREAFGELYDAIYPPVFRYCLYRSGNRSVAEDITSTVFLKVASNMVNFAGATFEDFRRWVFAIATNQCNADCRQRTRRSALLAEARNSGQLRSHSSVEDKGEHSGIDALQAAILTLDNRAQALITMRFFSGLSYEDIGVVLKVSPGTARTAMSRAIEELRGALGNDNESR